MPMLFGEFVVDMDQRRVFAGSREIHLTPKAFELLKVLLENRPKALRKDDLLGRIWPHTAVTENNPATLIADLRAALGDDAQHPRWIRTAYAYAYGYAFAADAVERRAGDAARGEACRWVLIFDEREISLNEGVNILGRTRPGTIGLEGPTVSRRHARVAIAGEQVIIEDLESKNGTWVGHAPVTRPTVVKDGDEIRLGSVLLVLRQSSPLPRTETAEPTGVVVRLKPRNKSITSS